MLCGAAADAHAGTLFLLMDLYQSPKLLYSFKIQPGKRFHRRDLSKLVRNLVLNSLCIYDPVGLLLPPIVMCVVWHV